MRPHHTRSAGTSSFVFHPSYANPTTITEGTTYTYYIQTTGVSNGTTLYWSITHGTTTSADFSANSGSFTVNNNLGIFNISPTNDNTQDNGESFTLTIRTESISGPIVLSRNITVNDPAPYATVSIEGAIEEGGAYTVTVYIYNMYANHTYEWVIQDWGTSSNDWNGATQGTFTTYNAGPYRVGNFTIYPKSDGIAEGNEYFGFYIYSMSTGQYVYNNQFTAYIIDPQPYADTSVMYQRLNSEQTYTIEVYIYNETANATYLWTAQYQGGNYYAMAYPSSGYFTTTNYGPYRYANFTTTVYGPGDGSNDGTLTFNFANQSTNNTLYGHYVAVGESRTDLGHLHWNTPSYIGSNPSNLCTKLYYYSNFYILDSTGELFGGDYTNYPFTGWLGYDFYTNSGPFDYYVNGYLHSTITC